MNSITKQRFTREFADEAVRLAHTSGRTQRRRGQTGMLGWMVQDLATMRLEFSPASELRTLVYSAMNPP